MHTKGRFTISCHVPSTQVLPAGNGGGVQPGGVRSASEFHSNIALKIATPANTMPRITKNAFHTIPNRLPLLMSAQPIAPATTHRLADFRPWQQQWKGWSRKNNASAPNPATNTPVTKPFLSQNHFTAAAIAQTYPNPIPAPSMIPYVRYNAYERSPRTKTAASKNERPNKIPPIIATLRGPLRSCNRLAGIIVIADVASTNENSHCVVARDLPNSYSRGLRKTLTP